MESSGERTDDPRHQAAELLRGVLDALPTEGARDVALRKAVEQRAAALDDLVNFESFSEGGSR